MEGTCCSGNGLGGPDTDDDQLCDPDAAVWGTSTWDDLDFQIEDAHGFVYSFNAEGTGDGASFVATANADLNCNAVQSTFQRMGFVPAAGLAADSCVPLGGSESWSESVLPYYFVHKLNE